MGRLTRARDWASTSVGPVESWTASLRTAVSMLLASRHAMFLWWGPDLIQFYNDGYRPSLGPDRHPSALGARGRECWAEIWPIIGGEIEAIMAGGDATWHEDHLVPITRGDAVHDVYWSYSYSPVHAAEDGAAAPGLFEGVQSPDLVVTDVIMPRLNGRQLYDAVAARWPGVPVLFISGHTGREVLLQKLVPPGAPFLQKPFTPEALARTVAELLALPRRTG